jgi:hypothetical protein
VTVDNEQEYEFTRFNEMSIRFEQENIKDSIILKTKRFN